MSSNEDEFIDIFPLFTRSGRVSQQRVRIQDVPRDVNPIQNSQCNQLFLECLFRSP